VLPPTPSCNERDTTHIVTKHVPRSTQKPVERVLTSRSCGTVRKVI
jgi:hypothetical protein